MLKLVQQEQPDVMVFTHPFPCGAASILKRQGHIDVPLVAIMTDFSSHQFWLYPQIDTYYVATESMVTEMVSAGIDEARIMCLVSLCAVPFSVMLLRNIAWRNL